MDVYDGHQREHGESKRESAPAQKRGGDISISDSPTLLEVLAYAYFPSACLCGPQFPLKRLRDFVSGKMLDAKTGKPHADA